MDIRSSQGAPRGHSPSVLSVLVVDDQLAVRDGLIQLLACAPLTLRDIVSAATADEALRIAAWLRPAVVLLDADLDGHDGLALIPLFSPAAVLVLTCHGDPATRQRAARLGARAFIEKHQPAAELLGAFVHLATLQVRGEFSAALQGAGSHVAAVACSDVPGPVRP